MYGGRLRTQNPGRYLRVVNDGYYDSSTTLFSVGTTTVRWTVPTDAGIILVSAIGGGGNGGLGDGTFGGDGGGSGGVFWKYPIRLSPGTVVELTAGNVQTASTIEIISTPEKTLQCPDGWQRLVAGAGGAGGNTGGAGPGAGGSVGFEWTTFGTVNALYSQGDAIAAKGITGGSGGLSSGGTGAAPSINFGTDISGSNYGRGGYGDIPASRSSGGYGKGGVIILEW